MSRFDIAATLKRLRAKSGMTADEVGLLIGKTGKTVNGWEHGRGQPDADILIKLADIYHVENLGILVKKRLKSFNFTRISTPDKIAKTQKTSHFSAFSGFSLLVEVTGFEPVTYSHG